MESCFEKINDSPKCFGEVFKLKGVFINIMLAIDELVYIKLLTCIQSRPFVSVLFWLIHYKFIFLPTNLDSAYKVKN